MEKATCTLPETHKWPVHDRPRVAHNEYQAGLELPIIDLSADTKEVLEKINQACSQWGFFQAINHGVDPTLLKKVESLSTSFFTLPDSMKAVVTKGNRKLQLYHSFYHKKYTKCSWVEGLNVHDMLAIPYIAASVWPENSSDISKTFTDYLRVMHELGNKILHMLVCSLGVEDTLQAKELLNGCGFTGTRFNYYPACPDPTMVLGIVPHTDPNCVTILHQDSVGGLQICKDQQWIAVKPIQNAFVINIGDSFEAWCNCRYRSVEHRAVVNSKTPRVSIAYFHGPATDFLIEAPSELVNEEHPRVHRPFRYPEYMTFRTQTNHHGKGAFHIFSDPRTVS